MAISIASTLGALRLATLAGAPAHGAWNASLLALGAYLVVLAVVFLLLPGINEVPSNFPAVTLWDFRIALPRHPDRVVGLDRPAVRLCRSPQQSLIIRNARHRWA